MVPQSVDYGTMSHYPILAACVARTTESVIECGTGFGSTPLLHYACRGRYLLSADSNPEWLGLFGGYANTDHHCRLITPLRTVVAGSSGVNEMIEAWVAFAVEAGQKLHPDVVFLDMAPGEARVPCAIALRPYAKFIVCHDREADEPGAGGNYRWRDLDGVFKYQSVMKRMRPWTGVYSDFEEFKIEAVDA
jgi:hypothetical protein